MKYKNEQVKKIVNKLIILEESIKKLILTTASKNNHTKKYNLDF